MDDKNLQEDLQEDLQEKNVEKEVVNVDLPKRKSPINLILTGLIVFMIALLAFQLFNMNNISSNDYNELLDSEDETVTVTKPEPVKLSVDLFDSATMLLDFSDITLSLENDDIRSYYEELVSDMSNFTQVYDKTFIPSDNIFELRFKETSTSIYFFNAVVGEQSYCTVVHDGTVVGNYLIPSTYYGNLFNVVYSSADVTAHTAALLKEDIASLIEHEKEVSIHLDESHKVVDNGVHLETFEALIKNKEDATMMYTLSDNKYVIVCYMNFKYYVFVVNAEGEILQEGNYKHYVLWDSEYFSCYNTSESTTEEVIMLDGDVFALKVVK